MEQPKSESPEISAGHEIRDAALRPILIFVVSFLAMLLIVQWVGRQAELLFQRHQETENRTTFPPNPLAGVMPTVPPDPRLEPEPSHDVLPKADLTEVRQREQSMIGPKAWGWVDPSHKFARIPVDEAMKLAVQNGLPEFLPATQPSAPPSMPPASAVHGPGGVP